MELLTRLNYFIQHVEVLLNFTTFLTHLYRAVESLPNQILMKLLKSQNVNLNHWYNELSWHCIQQTNVSHVLQAGVTYISRCTTTYYKKSSKMFIYFVTHVWSRPLVCSWMYINEVESIFRIGLVCLLKHHATETNVYCFKTLSHTVKRNQSPYIFTKFYIK